MKFKKGDKITVTEFGRGFENVTVKNIIEEKGRQYYVLKIINGTATIPISAEVNYELVEEKNKNKKEDGTRESV